VRAVLFDWGNTLVQDVWTEQLVRAATEAGLAAIGRNDMPDSDALAAYFEGREAELTPPDSDDEADLSAIYRECFEQVGSPLSDDELERYLEGVHGLWAEYEHPHPDAHALLDAIRSRGLRLAIVANVLSPCRFVEPLLARQGLLNRVDAVVLSSDVGKRKPHPAPFERALDGVATRPGDALFVGDRLYQDVLGASRLGMRTVQATWFVEDEHERGGTPDYRVASPLDVLNVIDG
jgi:putative hydrolase of the HAD superfamily